MGRGVRGKGIPLLRLHLRERKGDVVHQNAILSKQGAGKAMTLRTFT